MSRSVGKRTAGKPATLRMRTVVRWHRRDVLWTLVLTIMAGFQVWRGAWVDGVLFGLLVVMLVVDNQTNGRIRLLKRPITAPRWVILTITAALGVFLVVAPRHGWVDLVGIVAVGITVLLLAWVPDPPGPTRPARAFRTSLLLWSGLSVALCLWEAIAFILSTKSAAALQEYPTVSILLDPFVESPIGRIIVVTLWLLGGLGLLRAWSRP